MSGAKSWDLKLRTYALWTPHKEYTKSGIRKDNLSPCRFICWTNQISIGISQPLTQLQRHYNVEIPRVSLPNDRAKWDFRTDRYVTSYVTSCMILCMISYIWYHMPGASVLMYRTYDILIWYHNIWYHTCASFFWIYFWISMHKKIQNATCWCKDSNPDLHTERQPI